jgi:hypothetical protein
VKDHQKGVEQTRLRRLDRVGASTRGHVLEACQHDKERRYHDRTAQHEKKQRTADCVVLIVPALRLLVFGRTLGEAHAWPRAAIALRTHEVGPRTVARNLVRGILDTESLATGRQADSNAA